MLLKAVRIWLLIMAALLSAQAAWALTPQEIDELRIELVQRLSGQEQFAEMLAGIANAIVVPEISSAFYKIKGNGGSDTDASTTKIPYYHSFSQTGFGFTPFVGGVLGYLRSSENVSDYLPVTKGQLEMEEKWLGYSAMVEGGGKIPLYKGFFCHPRPSWLSCGLSRKPTTSTTSAARLLHPSTRVSPPIIG